jgi:hypothetical protein
LVKLRLRPANELHDSDVNFFVLHNAREDRAACNLFQTELDNCHKIGAADIDYAVLRKI